MQHSVPLCQVPIRQRAEITGHKLVATACSTVCLWGSGSCILALLCSCHDVIEGMHCMFLSWINTELVGAMVGAIGWHEGSTAALLLSCCLAEVAPQHVF
jgi:hypothetical protein